MRASFEMERGGGRARMSALALAAPALAQQPSEIQIPTSGEKVDGAPFEVKRDWGDLQARRPHRRQGQGGRADQLRLLLPGLRHSAVLAAIRGRLRNRLQDRQRDLSLDCAAIAPVQNDPNQQVVADRGQARGRRDRLHRRSSRSTSDAMTAIINKLMDQGIPVFTVGVTSRGHEFTNFTQVPELGGRDRGQDRARLDEGQQQGHQGVRGLRRRSDPVLGARADEGLPGDDQGKAIPDAKFVTTEANGLNVSYDPGKTYDIYRSFLSANPDVQFIENVDIGAEHADRAIKSLGRTGQGLHHRLERLEGPARRRSRRACRWRARPALAGSGGVRRRRPARNS